MEKEGAQNNGERSAIGTGGRHTGCFEEKSPETQVEVGVGGEKREDW